MKTSEFETVVFDPEMPYGGKLINPGLSYKVLGICFEVHRILGKGFLEAVYKEALDYEFDKAGINFIKEKRIHIAYKDIILKKEYSADYLIEDELILEVKAQNGDLTGNYKQVINYLAVARCKVSLLVNFNNDSLKYKRLVL